MSGERLLGAVRGLLETARKQYAGSAVEPALAGAAERIEEPLRVAIAGKVKAGKSTLLNALVGEELAPTDAGECTRIVTWYRDGHTYRVLLEPREGAPVQARFSREAGALEVDLDGRDPEEVERLLVDWPSASLRQTTLIDTPGIGSLTRGVSERVRAFLAPDDDAPTPADAVLYLMRHLHGLDVRFLEAFHDDEFAQATPINAIGVLSRADEIGVGRLDALDSARRIAARYREDPKLRRLCQTVVPVAGLLAQSGAALREAEFRALERLGRAPAEEEERLLLSADRFAGAQSPVELTPAEREHLLLRFGLFGVRLASTLVRRGEVTSAAALSARLVAESGLDDLRAVLSSQFSARRDVLKARSALFALDGAIHAMPEHPATPGLAGDLERIGAGAHEFAEIRLLNAYRSGAVAFHEREVPEVERLLGSEGASAQARAGLPPDASTREVRSALTVAIERWQRRAESPMSSQEIAEASRVLVRSCEGMLADLHE